jgi:DNA-directed RNA polymerase subunit RPC12/RpoP
MSVIRGTREGKKRVVVVEKTGHPAAYRKVRCSKCSLGYAVQDNEKPELYRCQRCGFTFKNVSL